jgi:pectate lyase
MKKLITICILVLVIAASPATAYLAELVDLGTTAGETGYTIIDWGPVQPTTSGGNWGSLATDIQSCDNLCRTVWSTGNANWASITFDDKILAVEIRHLDGTADDSFKVEVDGSL